ncbi:hypothetical protein G9A89_010139 [Geosiphon pyriformis]|nr:hypothetical protein G9A89_010139 [Geosiphon pyriformis]
MDRDSIVVLSIASQTRKSVNSFLGLVAGNPLVSNLYLLYVFYPLTEVFYQAILDVSNQCFESIVTPLGKINFSGCNNSDNVLLDTPLELPSSLKNLVTVSVRKSFTLDIGLDKVIRKSSQEKLMVVRKLFLRINGFGGASTLSKFSGIIKVSFTSESSLAQASKKAENAKILVNTDLKKSTGHSDQAVVVKEIPVETLAEAVCVALSEFRIIKSIKMQLVGLWQKAVVKFKQLEHTDLVAAEWSILIGKNAVHVVRADLDKKT